MSVLTQQAPPSGQELAPEPSHRAQVRATLPRPGVPILCGAALAIVAWVGLTVTLGFWGVGAGLAVALLSAVVVRRHRMRKAWQVELEVACGVYERRSINLGRAL